MIVQVLEGRVTIAEPEDFTRLHVASDDPDGLDSALRSTGCGYRRDVETVYLDVVQLRLLAEEAASGTAIQAEWESGWAAMVDYAARKGWLDHEGRSLVAHVEWVAG